MGWFHGERPGHEGYVVGLEEVERRWRSITVSYFRELNQQEDDERRELPVKWVQVACECGWRSRRFTAPFGTKWYPCATELPSAEHEDAARALWAAHMASPTADAISVLDLRHADPAVARSVDEGRAWREEQEAARRQGKP